MEKRLVVLCAGPEAMLFTNRWDRVELREFQLWILWYGDPALAPSTAADKLVCGSGSKWDLVRSVAQDIAAAHPQWIWIPDDDIALDVLNVNQFFERCDVEKPHMAQPSLAPRNVSCAELVHVPGGAPVREVGFIEIQMPCFCGERTWPQALDLLRDNADNHSGWGLDVVWSRWEGVRKLVHNEVVAVHTRPVNIGSGFYKALCIDPNQEYSKVMAKYNLQT